MEKFWWRAVWGLCLVQLSLAQIQLNVTCRYDGVFHVEKNGRYSISRTEAADLCKAFNCSLPTMAQMEKARKAGFETCRYGFIEGHVVIPRIHPNAICAANHTGVYILTSNTSHYDTYCFNASAPEGHDCASITDLPNAFDGPITISIINSDGSKYIQKGEYRTNPEDINSSNYTNSTEDDMSSGFSSERSTLGDYIFHTHLPTAQPTQDQGNRWEFVTPEETPTTSMDSSLISAGWEPTEEDESDKHPIHSGSGIDDDEDFISSTTTRRVFDDPKQNDNLQQWSPDFLNPEILLQTTTRMTADVDRNVTSDYGEDWTQEPHSTLTRHEHHEEEEAQQSASTNMDSSHSTTLQPSADPNTSLVEDLDRIEPFSMTTQQSHTQRLTTSHEGLEEDNDHPMISTPKSSNRNDEGGENLPKDSTTSVEGYTPQSPDTNEYRTFIPVTPAGTGSPGVTEVPVVGNSISNVDGSLSEDHGSSSDPSGRAHTTQGSESAGHSSGSQGGANTTSGPIRKPQIPEWLIILASLLALALILAVCIAVNSRRRCGQKKKLVINNGNGAVEDRKPSGLNGEASKSQEMVHLVNKEPSETPDQFMTADETRNLQNVDMKIGV
ncbi:PREDICTED: CD44 antigen isoform X9 [Hipposideros armiger]|uniref:CD44 antigen n=1 Tax=Hipposideros armiger TaxID=186990 RepID=A0A8B7R388_HIPAR|nr:PREDICTED: CD44 antigen isoform X9 [Hipposideros armiger]